MSASIAFILFAAAITPGPNNLVVLDVARRNFFATLAPIAGIVLGTLALILAASWSRRFPLSIPRGRANHARRRGLCARVPSDTGFVCRLIRTNGQ